MKFYLFFQQIQFSLRALIQRFWWNITVSPVLPIPNKAFFNWSAVFIVFFFVQPRQNHKVLWWEHRHKMGYFLSFDLYWIYHSALTCTGTSLVFY